VARLIDGLRHRGPDGEGFWVDGPQADLPCSRADLPEAASVVLGHRRLSIVDLATGDQPIANEDRTVWVTFNGEIYNHVELRGALEGRGHRFATRSDTEVLVHGWEEWGEGLLERLNGIFAFALADWRSEGRIVLARDPAGVKPLYLGTGAGHTWWSSELGSARSAGLSGAQISIEGLKLFLLFRFVPSPFTIFQGVWKVPPGHFVSLPRTLAGNPPGFTAYPSTVRSTAQPKGQGEWREAIMSELEAAVSRQLMSDVPIGCLLSGRPGSRTASTWLPGRPHLPA
jgi:asparagine synthase (glutamine-hydrolysing)